MNLSEKRKALFLAKVEKTSSCWFWTGRLNPHGYGECSVKNKTKKAHRVSLAIEGIEVPEGMVVDHVCRVRHCVNPEHLRFVTPRMNTLENSESLGARNSKKLECMRGHTFDAVNTAISGKQRICRKCRAARRSRMRKLMTKEQRDRDRGKIPRSLE